MLKLSIKEKQIDIVSRFDFIRGMVGVECQVDFEDFWLGYQKTIVFKRCDSNARPIVRVIREMSEKIVVPYEILTESGNFVMGCFGENENQTLPTLWSEPISILYGTDTYGDLPNETTPSLYEQLRRQIEPLYNNMLLGNIGNGILKTENISNAVITDISPIPHYAHISAPTQKNLLPFPYDFGEYDDGNIRVWGDKYGVIHIDGTLLHGSDFTLVLTNDIPLKSNTQYTMSISEPIATGVVILSWERRNTSDVASYGGQWSVGTSGAQSVVGFDNTHLYFALKLRTNTGNVEFNDLQIKLMVEEGLVASKYVPYNADFSEHPIFINEKEYITDENGNIKNIPTSYPQMEIDTNGLPFNFTYSADIKKYIDEKFAAIQALTLEA